MSILLGCIADDVTGAVELAGLLRRSGIPVRLHLGVPDGSADPDTAAPFEVVALKCRHAPANEAIDAALAAWQWLSAGGARRVYWKYCSTFDSTASGNIGPVADALLDALNREGSEGAALTLHCPDFLEAGRQMDTGNLFGHEHPARESPKTDHPVTPMHDSDLARLLGAQTPHAVARLTLPEVNQEREWVCKAIDALAAGGVRHIVGDAIDDLHLVSLIRATEHLRLLCGGSALASHLPAMFRVRGFLSSADQRRLPAAPQGGELVLSGSCSETSRQQVAAWPEDAPSLVLEPGKLVHDPDFTNTRARFAAALQSAAEHAQPLLVYAATGPGDVRKAPGAAGVAGAGKQVQDALATLATDAIEQGVRRLVLAGIETSDAVMQALGITQLDVGHDIVPGVPWCRAGSRLIPSSSVAIALTSGNGGGQGFFTEAFERIEPPGDDDER